MAHEALVNAVRHGAATRAGLGFEQVGDDLRLTIEDNGRGFPFQGQFSMAALTVEKLGPVMLKQRVTALGGELTIQSSPAGARLDIRLPLGEGGEDAD